MRCGAEGVSGASTEAVRVRKTERGRAGGETNRHTHDGRANDVHVVHLVVGLVVLVGVFFPVVPVACGCGCANGMRVARSALTGMNVSVTPAESSRQLVSSRSWRRRSGSFK